MISNVLGVWIGGMIEWIVVLGLPIILIFLFVRFLVRGSKEKQKLRMELGKLADEVQQLRAQLKTEETSKPSTKSG